MYSTVSKILTAIFWWCHSWLYLQQKKVTKNRPQTRVYLFTVGPLLASLTDSPPFILASPGQTLSLSKIIIVKKFQHRTLVIEQDGNWKFRGKAANLCFAGNARQPNFALNWWPLNAIRASRKQILLAKEKMIRWHQRACEHLKTLQFSKRILISWRQKVCPVSSVHFLYTV